MAADRPRQRAGDRDALQRLSRPRRDQLFLADRPALHHRGQHRRLHGDLDATHAWTFSKDVAWTLIEASRYTGEWGRAFHVPSQHASPNELIRKTAAMLDRHIAETHSYSIPEMEALGMQELIEMRYLLETPLLVDSSDADTLGREGQQP
ncbi:hypothetical protein [Mesorhizobium sp.]|uniref:hypothetical protein n=1 Tax=Mesorhizobium sp. TaxID=1871066 RepID=UPI0025C380AF|nr:hypothetical protein [Mesorhizobium sp.]